MLDRDSVRYGFDVSSMLIESRVTVVQLRPTATNVARSVVSWCVLGTPTSPAKTDESIEMLSEGADSYGPKETRSRIRRNALCRRHLANTTERSASGNAAALCQTAWTTSA